MKRVPPVLCLLAAVVALTRPAAADERPIIFHGKVMMWDGSSPGRSVAIEKVCSDRQGNRSGPITNKEGVFTWRFGVDQFSPRRCYLRASVKGYTSTEIEISNVNGFVTTTVELDPIVLAPAEAAENPRSIDLSIKAPKKARDDWKAAIDALQAGNNSEVLSHLQAAVAAEPEFAEGWHTLGIVLESQGQRDQARDAYQKAHDLDEKYLAPYVTLGQFALETSEWQTALDLGQALAKIDKQRVYPDAYLFMAVAQFEMKDLDGAEANALEALNPKKDTKSLRAEYVLGRIYAAKGDLDAAREHIERYLELKPDASDAAQIKASLETLGQFSAAPPPNLFAR